MYNGKSFRNISVADSYDFYHNNCTYSAIIDININYRSVDTIFDTMKTLGFITHNRSMVVMTI